MKKLLLTATLLTAFNAAGWEYKEQIDLMTDEDTSYIYADAGESFAAVRCGQGGYEIFVGFKYLGREAKKTMVRFDKEKPYQLDVNASGTGRALFAASHEEEKLIANMKKHSVMAIQTMDFNYSKVSAKISLKGFSDAVKKLSCVE